MRFALRPDLLAFGLSALLLGGCAKDDLPIARPATTGALAVDVENIVGSAPLVLNTQRYRSPAGEEFTVSMFRYYLSNFRLHRADGSTYAVPDSYHLVRELGPGDPWTDTGKHFVLDSLPVGDYTGLSFLIGVDEERNTTGAQTGALDPNNYMFWTWNQGYIFLQMEGSSPQSGETGTRLLAYHVGDFRNPNNIREVQPPLPGGVPIRVRAGRVPAVQLRADVLRLFAGADADTSFPVRFGPFWSAIGGADAARVATNYSGSPSREVVGTNSMFTVANIK